MYDIYADKRPTIIGVAFGTWAVAILVLLLRMGSRKARGVKLGLDDWLILGAVVRLQRYQPTSFILINNANQTLE